MRFSILSFALMLAASLSVAATPNFLIILADDCTYNDLPLYGGKNAKTPHLDSLASRGLVFNQAYLAEAMCQPCRSELYSGLYPVRNGSAWNHSASRPGTRSLPHYLKPLGYRVGLAGKTHVKPKDSFPFQPITGFEKSCVRDVTANHDLDPLRTFFEEDTPFCAVVALVEPHVPWTMGDASQYPPNEIELPPNLVDNETTRQHFADYLAEITYMDSQVGDILAALEASGKTDNTLVLFSSEQGSQFPGCKWTNWNTGVHTTMIASWPGRVSAGQRTDDLVQYVDVAPTLLDLAGATDHEFDLDGVSFAPVLLGTGPGLRKYTYHIHNNVPEGPPYPIRAVGNGTWRYLRNLRPDEIYIEKHLMGGGRLNNPYWATWVGEDPKHTQSYQLVKRYMRRPAEQLYQSISDPYEMENLAQQEEHEAIQTELAGALDAWMTEQKDPGAAMDTLEALGAARKGKHQH